MSDMDIYRGTLSCVAVGEEDVIAELKKRGAYINPEHSIAENISFDDRLYDSVYYDEDSEILYEVSKKKLPSHGFCSATKTKTGYDFILMYDSSISFNEVLEQAVDEA